MSTALRVKFLESFDAFIGAALVVEYSHYHLVHSLPPSGNYGPQTTGVLAMTI
jgi:hypothetical protein